MSEMLYEVQMQQDEHRPENNAKAVDNYLWDADNLQWVRSTGNADGTLAEPLPTIGHNPSYTITEATVGDVTTTTIEKLIGSTTYTKTVTENASTGVTSVTSWS